MGKTIGPYIGKLVVRIEKGSQELSRPLPCPDYDKNVYESVFNGNKSDGELIEKNLYCGLMGQIHKLILKDPFDAQRSFDTIRSQISSSDERDEIRLTDKEDPGTDNAEGKEKNLFQIAGDL